MRHDMVMGCAPSHSAVKRLKHNYMMSNDEQLYQISLLYYKMPGSPEIIMVFHYHRIISTTYNKYT